MKAYSEKEEERGRKRSRERERELKISRERERENEKYRERTRERKGEKSKREKAKKSKRERKGLHTIYREFRAAPKRPIAIENVTSEFSLREATSILNISWNEFDLTRYTKFLD